MSLKDMPVVTVEQIVRFREAALKVEQQRDDLLAAAKITVGDLMDSYRTHGTEWFLDATRDLRNAIAEIEAAQ
jgi:hypothetical protein